MKTNPYTFRHATYLDNLLNIFKYSRLQKRFAPTDFQRACADEIRKNGFVQIDNFLKHSDLNYFQKDINKRLMMGQFSYPTLAQSKIDPIKHKDLIDNFLIGTGETFLKRGIAFESKDFQSYEQVLNDFIPSTLDFKIPPNDINYLSLWLHPDILGIVEAYMGFKPKLLEAYVRRNFPSPYRTMNHFWHRDLNNKFHLLKAFIFFTDTDFENGPHEFINQSHIDFSLNGQRYYTDEEINEAYASSPEKINTTKVKAGTIIIEDTRGLHRAKLPEKRYRDLGYAVFLPLPWYRKYSHVNYLIEEENFQQLKDFQKGYILKNCILNK